MTIANARPSRGVEIAWPRPVDFRLSNGQIQYRVRGTTAWITIFNLNDLGDVNEQVVLAALQSRGFTVDGDGLLHLTALEQSVATLATKVVADVKTERERAVAAETSLGDDLNAEIQTRQSQIETLSEQIYAASAGSSDISGLVAGQLGTSASDLRKVTFGPALVAGDAAGAAGTIWVDGGTILSDGGLTVVSPYIRTLGGGDGYIVLLKPDGGVYRPQAYFKVKALSTGINAFYAGVDFPVTVVESGWRLGWIAPAGGALISYRGNTGATSLNGIPPDLRVDSPVGLNPGTAEIAIQVTQYTGADAVVGNPLVAGFQPNAAGTLQIYANDQSPFERDMILRTLGAYIQTAGNGQGSFLLLSPQAAGYKIEHRIDWTGLVVGAKVLTAGQDFAPFAVAAGWILGWWSPAGGALLAYDVNGSSTYLPASTIAVGTTYGLQPSDARLALAATASVRSSTIAAKLDSTEESVDALDLTTARAIGSVLGRLGTQDSEFAEVTYGNPIIVGDADAPGGYIWANLGAPLKAGPLVSLQIQIQALGTGKGRFVILRPDPSGGLIYRIAASFAPKRFMAAGSKTLYAGKDFPALSVEEGWLVGWYAAADGARVSYRNGTGGSALNIATSNTTVGQPVSMVAAAVELGISATIARRADVLVGNAAVPGLYATAAAVQTLWVNTGNPFPDDAPIRTLSLYAQGAGDGKGSFLLLSPLGDGNYRLEKIVARTDIAPAFNVFRAGLDFVGFNVKRGWVLGWWAPSTGAYLGYDGNGASSFLAAPAIAEGGIYGLNASGALLSLYATAEAVPAPVVPRLAATESAVRDLQAKVTQAAQASVSDLVTAANATIAGSNVSVTGTLRRGGNDLAFIGSLTLDAATTGSVTNEALTIVPGVLAYAGPAANRLANANVSNVVVRDAGSNALLVYGTDYLVGFDHGTVALVGTGSRAVKVSYTYSRRRYDAIVLDPETRALSVVKGTERNRDAAEFVPAISSSGLIRLFNVRVSGLGLNTVPTYDLANGLRRACSEQADRDRRRNADALLVTRSKIARGIVATIAGTGDSIMAIQSDQGSLSTPNGATRDRATASGTPNTYLRDAIAPDAFASLPLYDNGDGAGQVHTRMSMFWTAIRSWQRRGAVIRWLNFGVAGTTTADGLNDPLYSAVANSAADLVVIHYGMNQLGAAAIEAQMRTRLDSLYAAGKEVMVVSPPRTNGAYGLDYDAWNLTCRALRRAAEYVDPTTGKSAAFVDTRLIYASENLGALGLHALDLCQANLYNHPGMREHDAIGRLIVAVAGVDPAGTAADAWTTGTPTLTPSSGSLSATSGTLRYQQVGKRVDINGSVQFTLTGSGVVGIYASLPFAAGPNASFIFGREAQANGKTLVGDIQPSATSALLLYSDQTSFAAGTYTLKFSGTYEIA